MTGKSHRKSPPKMKSETAVDHWLQKADLTEYFTGDEFHKVRFAKLEKKLVDEAYEKSLQSQPVTIRLPRGLIQKLKLAALKKGLAYQTLARILLQERVNQLLSH